MSSDATQRFLDELVSTAHRYVEEEQFEKEWGLTDDTISVARSIRAKAEQPLPAHLVDEDPQVLKAINGMLTETESDGPRRAQQECVGAEADWDADL